MTMKMELNLLGRVDNLHLPVTGALIPLYEAVVNSIQAIEDLGSASGMAVRINVIREAASQASLTGDRELPPIRGFEIVDTGIGFNEANYTSFRTSDSRFKQAKGGKGIGRLFWLKAFESVTIESVFDNKGSKARRKIEFALNSISSSDETATPNSKIETKVTLLGFKEAYRKACKKRTASIAERLIEHCLIYLLDPKCPNISIHDAVENVDISLNQRFKEIFDDRQKKATFTLPSTKESFELILLSVYSAEEISSKLHWCANGRDVFEESLSKLVPNLRGKIKDSDSRSYVIVAYLSGKFLDEKVNADRSAFNIQEENLNPEQGELDKLITLSEIRSNASQTIKNLLEPELAPIQKEKHENIRKYVSENAPQYRALVDFESKTLEEIPPGLTEEKLDVELHKAQFKLEARLKEQGQKFIQEIKNAPAETEEIKKKQEEYFKQVSAVSQANLAKYVLGRKVILELYSDAIKQKENGKFEKEEFVHNLIFPRYKTSNEIKYDQHNLWIVDERLAYHSYLASEKKISALEGVESTSEERPDVIVFNNPSVFTEGSDGSFSSVTIIEFKRPGREDASTNGRDPIQQLYDYVNEVREGRCRDKDGHELRVAPQVPFFAFLVCDLTPEVVKAAKGAGLTPAADNQGYFGFNPGYSAYIEILSFKKVFQDAQKRNRAFFDKLSL